VEVPVAIASVGAERDATIVRGEVFRDDRPRRAAGITDLELIIFEVPQPTPAGALPLAVEPPAEGFSLAGWDVIELIEPFCSALRDAPESLRRNDFGLLTDRPSAESLARAHNATAPDDEVVAARIWRPDA
jgi:hypothetical protein